MTGLKPPIMAALYINLSLATTYIGTMAVLVIGIGVIMLSALGGNTRINFNNTWEKNQVKIGEYYGYTAFNCIIYYRIYLCGRKSDTSGLEVIFSILMVFGLFYLIYKVGMFGAFIIGLIFLVIVFAIAVSNDKNEKKWYNLCTQFCTQFDVKTCVHPTTSDETRRNNKTI